MYLKLKKNCILTKNLSKKKKLKSGKNRRINSYQLQAFLIEPFCHVVEKIKQSQLKKTTQGLV